MPFWQIVLSCAVLPEILFGSQCAHTPWKGSGAEIIATKFDDMTCGDPPNSYDCSRYIEAKLNSDTGYSQVRLAGNYSLLGSVYCNAYPSNGSCTLSTIGDVTVGCCGTFHVYEYFVGENGSSLTVGSHSVVKLAMLKLEDYSLFTTGNNTRILDLYQTSSITVGGLLSTVTFYGGCRLILVNTVIEIKDVSNLNFECPIGVTVISNSTWFARLSDVYIKPNNEASFRQSQMTLVYSNVVIEDLTILAWTNVNLNLNEALIDWVSNSSVNFTFTDVTMAERSKWIMTNSNLVLTNTHVTIGIDSSFILTNCGLQASNMEAAYNVTIGQNSSFVIRSNTNERLTCNLSSNLIIPPNIRYTEADVSDMLSCNLASMEDMKIQSNDTAVITRNAETGDTSLELIPIHYDSCPIVMTTVSTSATSQITTVTTITEHPTTTTTNNIHSETSIETTTFTRSRAITTETPTGATGTTVPPSSSTVTTVSPDISSESTASSTIPTATTVPPTITTTTSVPATIPTATTVLPTSSTTTTVPPTVTKATTVAPTTHTTTTDSATSTMTLTISITTTHSSNTTNSSTRSTNATTTAVDSSSRATTSAGVQNSLVGPLLYLVLFSVLLIVNAN